jgi:uncharacterized protein
VDTDFASHIMRQTSDMAALEGTRDMNTATGLAFPFRFNASGQTTLAEGPAHIRDMIHQVLFTTPGERVMRPDFGSGLGRLVFAPASVDLAAATEMLVRGALQTWLGEIIEVADARATIQEGRLEVMIDYLIRETGEARTDTFSTGGGL